MPRGMLPLWIWMEQDGTVTTIAERWQGKRFNKPNDVVCRSDGSIFFTDPGCDFQQNCGRLDFPVYFASTRRAKCIWPLTSANIPTA